MTDRTCTIEGCEKPRRGKKWCRMHRARWERHGDPNVKLRGGTRIANDAGYIYTTDRSHPLARTSGAVYEHRRVLFDAIGEGPHPCHWCGAALTWRGDPNAAEYLCVDHLDGTTDNNHASNLVPSCRTCNVARAVHPKLRRTECSNGHPYTPENTTINKAGHRRCRECRRKVVLRYEARKRALR